MLELQRRQVILFAVLLFLLSGVRAFGVSVEIFGAVPMVVSDISDEPAAYKSYGAGIAITTLERDATFGLTAAGITYSPFFAESIKKAGAAKADRHGVGEVFFLPFGFHLSLGCSVLPFETRVIFFPVTVSFHFKTDYLRTETHIDMGVAAAAGIKCQVKRVNFFVRAEIFFDIYRVVIPFRGKLETKGPNVFGVTPQAGIGFTF
ncbi:MAG: hypothetical protein Pg6C_19650 [Treponemataceae bacterium]|nr:MAG: hypothetical protein Pg6C_19650 [Treponemataceae bacterium]